MDFQMIAVRIVEVNGSPFATFDRAFQSGYLSPELRNQTFELLGSCAKGQMLVADFTELVDGHLDVQFRRFEQRQSRVSRIHHEMSETLAEPMRDREPQHAGVESLGPIEVFHVQRDVMDACDL